MKGRYATLEHYCGIMNMVKIGKS